MTGLALDPNPCLCDCCMRHASSAPRILMSTLPNLWYLPCLATSPSGALCADGLFSERRLRLMSRLSGFVLLVLLILLTLSCGGSQSSGSTPPPPPPPSYSFTSVHSFTGGTDGCCPSQGLLLDSTGNLYGTGVGGNGAGSGTVFKVNSSGDETILLNFTGNGQPDGLTPVGSLVSDPDGNLYGTTLNGGSYSYGTVFQLLSNGQASDLHSFGGWVTGDGASPFSGLVRDGEGNLYGVTNNGGTGTVCVTTGGGCGTLYEIQADGEETLLYQFGTIAGDAASPMSGLLLVGTTLYGTAGGGASGYGVVFSFDLASGTETVIYNFVGGTDGKYPAGILVHDGEGNLYGVTQSGGSQFDAGTVFKLNPSTGAESVLYSFQLSATDGGGPTAGPVMDSGGNLYGTTQHAGAHDCGTAYKLSPTGSITTLYAFNCSTDGFVSNGSLVMDAKGNLYGTTSSGGANGFGNVFKLSPP